MFRHVSFREEECLKEPPAHVVRMMGEQWSEQRSEKSYHGSQTKGQPEFW